MGELFQGKVKTDLVMIIVRVVIMIDPMSWFIFLPTFIFQAIHHTVLSVSIGEVLIDHMVKSHKCAYFREFVKIKFT